jgi:hypothetical protein
METKNPQPCGQGALSVLGRNVAAPGTTPSYRATERWQALAYKNRKVSTELAAYCALPCPADREGIKAYENELSRLSDVDADALTDLLLHPAPSLGALAEIEIFKREQIEDGWWRGREMVSTLARDAERLLWPHRHLAGEA